MSAIRRRVLVSILIVSVNIHGLRASGKHLVKAARVKVATDAQRRECQARFGRSGSALPELLKQAAAALPQPYFVHPEEIVYIEDLARFLDCLGITGEI